tara:strand:- start:167 stop:379 length:213 start_codon:yes stop_codon:yes gene_type:complete
VAKLGSEGALGVTYIIQTKSMAISRLRLNIIIQLVRVSEEKFDKAVALNNPNYFFIILMFNIIFFSKSYR